VAPPAYTNLVFRNLPCCGPHLPRFTTADSRWASCSYSYYAPSAPPHPVRNGVLLAARVIAEVIAWRRRVDAGLNALLERARQGIGPRGRTPAGACWNWGWQHEQQHQGAPAHRDPASTGSAAKIPLRTGGPWRGAPGPKRLWPQPVAGPLAPGWLGPAGLVEESAIQPDGGGFPLPTPRLSRHRVLAGALNAIANRLVRQTAKFNATFIRRWRLPSARNCGLSEGLGGRAWLRAWAGAPLWRGSGPAPVGSGIFQPGPAAAPCNPRGLPFGSSQLLFEADAYAPGPGCPLPQRGRVDGRCLCRKAQAGADGLWRAIAESGMGLALAVDRRSP